MFDLEKYLSESAERIVKDLIKTSVFNPKESIFMAKFALAAKKASAIRHEAEARGEHIPPFLIAGITGVCNLHCAGCYARSLGECSDIETCQLSGEEWGRIFREARELGISFILLAGGEPTVRKDVILQAAKIPEIAFPIFTNGTMITKEYIDLFDKNRNLIPVLSIEGDRARTDARRGEGVYEKLANVMRSFKKRGIAFGASVTVTSENMTEVISKEFTGGLAEKGCKAVIFVEFVPTDEKMTGLALTEAERGEMETLLNEVRGADPGMMIISFPGDEKSSGGCLAAGRGFFYINAQGGAEPCPFSPYSDFNLRGNSLKEALNSQLFRSLRESEILASEHTGGCVLFERRGEVKELMRNA